MSAPSSSGRKPKEAKELIKENALPNYQLGDLLGKGASGQVFRALNFTNGETVAVKQIQLTNIPKSELGDIMSEIHLLKNLNHPNIVKYNGFVKTKEFLYIILEYCENGSLHAICKRFGKFPENLVAVYISQVLEGLQYLHEQGVIHRDIKGANILTNKDGRVKLADFGVATAGGVNDLAVVGSPYWMAPEVIEQAGASTASDIWSVGCVVIELLEGKPPYHALEPMQALFRIVQDDTPPIPPGASEVVKDFLLTCFQKDPNLRVSAKKLMKHQWMTSARRQMTHSKEPAATSTGRHREEPGSMRGSRRGPLELAPKAESRTAPESSLPALASHDEQIQRVQEWNEKLVKTSYAAVASSSSGSLSGIGQSSTALPNRRPSSGYGPTHFPPLHPSAPHTGLGPSLTPTTSLTDALSAATNTMSPISAAVLPVTSKAVDQAALMRKMEESQEFSDNWDDDFADGISLNKLSVPARDGPLDPIKPTTDEEEEAHDEPEHWNMKTIMPTRSPSLNGNAVLPSVGPSKPQSSVEVEDWSDMMDDGEDDLGLSTKVAQLSISNRKGVFHPNDLKSLGFSTASPAGVIPVRSLSNPLSTSSSAPRSPRTDSHSRQPLQPTAYTTTSTTPPVAQPFASLRLTRPRSDSPTLGLGLAIDSPTGMHRTPSDRERRMTSGREIDSSRLTAGSESGSGGRSMESDLRKYSEGAEDYEDVFGKGLEKNTSTSSTLQLNTKLSNRSWLGDNDDEVDPFAEIEESYEDDADLETNLLREEHARLASTITSLVAELQSSAPDFTLGDACDQILNIITDVPEMQAQLVSCHGMLAILEILETKPSKQVILRMLRIINIINIPDVSLLESFCLIGGIPIVISFTSKKYSTECRFEAAVFISAVCNSSVQTLQMFISCRGLKVLVELLDEDYSQHRELVVAALGGIGSVFRLQGPTPRQDFCRMFIREGIEDPLSTALLNISADRDEGGTEAKIQILAVFLIFCQASQKDSRVREALANRRIIRRVLNTCSALEPALLVVLLKSVYHLSTTASTLEVLQNANAIEIVTDVLADNISGPHSTEISNHILQTLYKLCWLNKSRQEEAAQAGIIPLLTKIIRASSPLKQFAVPILLDFANAGKTTRNLLWQKKVLPIYLELVSETGYWQGQALEAVSVWLQEETSRVEEVLEEESGATHLLRCFVGAKAGFEKILDPFLKILRTSSAVALALSKPVFFRRLVERLTKMSRPHVRLSLLRITRTVTELHPDRVAIAETYGLYDIVERLSRQDGAILVQGLALEILPTLRPPPTRRSVLPPQSTPAGILPRKALRRTTSETGVAGLPTVSSSSSSPILPRSPSGLQPTPASKRKPSRAQLSEIRWTDDGHGGLQRAPSTSTSSSGLSRR